MISEMAKLFIDNAELSADSKKQCNYALQRVYAYEIKNKCNVYEFSEIELKICLEKCFSDVKRKKVLEVIHQGLKNIFLG